MPFMNKTLSKEIMKRTKLHNKFLKERTNETINDTHHNEIIAFHAKKDKEKLL